MRKLVLVLMVVGCAQLREATVPSDAAPSVDVSSADGSLMSDVPSADTVPPPDASPDAPDVLFEDTIMPPDTQSPADVIVPLEETVVLPDVVLADNPLPEAAADVLMTVDAAPPVDVPSEAALPDVPVRDATPEAAPPTDTGPDVRDSGPSDTGSDVPADRPDVQPVTGGCADGTEDQVYTGHSMVGCDGAQTQCRAVTLCNAGWHLCTIAEYTARGGSDVPSLQYHWIAACIRQGMVPAMCPTSSICPSCTSETTLNAENSDWLCGGSNLDNTNAVYTGIATTTLSMAKRRTGCFAATCAYTMTYPASAPAGAVCCS